MKNDNNKTINLSDDIKQIVIDSYGRDLNMLRLCRDHNDPLLHRDNKAVLNITLDEFVRIFDMNIDHYFLKQDQVVRFGEFCKLPLPNIIALTLKAEWELFLSGVKGYSNGTGMKLKSILEDQQLIEMYLDDFKPDKGKIFKLIQDIAGISNRDKNSGYINFFIDDLLNDNNFLIGNEQVNILYPEKDTTEKMLLYEVSESGREEYFQLKELWKVKSTELDNILLNLERRKKLNIAIENKYFKTFGNSETDKSRLKYAYEKYKIILDAMQSNPELSYRQLITLATTRLIEADRKRNDLKNKITRSLNYITVPEIKGFSSQVTNEFKDSYMQACKKLLRKLFFLLHSDTCPNYSGLSQQKKTGINNLWLELMSSTKNELCSYSPAMLLYSLPDYEQLESIYKRACEILEIDPEDYQIGDRLEFMIRKGTPIKKIVEFLKSETAGLELHLSHLELIQSEYTNEDQTQFYRNALENITEHSEKLKNEISALKNQILKLKKKISDRLNKVTANEKST